MQGFNYTALYQALQDWPLEASSLYLANINRLIYLGELRLIRDLVLDLFDVNDSVPLTPGAGSVPKPAQGTVITFTAPIAAGSTGALLAAAWTGTTGTYATTFSDGELQAVTLTNTSTNATWAAPLAAPVGATARINPLMVVERNLWCVYSGQIRLLSKRSFDFIQNYAGAAAGRPLYYCDSGTSSWLIAPAADANATSIIRHYIQRPESIVIAQNTWMGDNLGDVLFVAVLMEAEQFLKADDRYADMRTKYYQELLPNAASELQIARRKGDYTPLEPVAGLPGPPPPPIQQPAQQQ